MLPSGTERDRASLLLNVHDGRHIKDGVGFDLADDGAARVEALGRSGELLRDFSKEGISAGKEWSLDVTDQDDRRVATLRFSGETHEP